MPQNLDDPRVVEIWILFAVGTLVTFFRLYSRGSLLGIRGLQADDYFAFIAILFWSAMCFCDTTIRSSSKNISPLLLKQLGYATIASETMNHTQLLDAGVKQAEIDNLEYILQLNWSSWLLKPPLLWSLKLCMVVFFLRLTNNLPWMRKATLASGLFVVLTFIAAEGVILLTCIPLSANWNIFDNKWRKCSSSSTHTQIINYLLVGVGNILTDIVLILIPIPMLWKVRIPRARKMGTGFLLCSGVFIVVIGVIRTACGIMSYRAKGGRALELREVSFAWGMRENFTAVVIVNSIAIRPFFSSTPWKNIYSRITGSKLSTGASTSAASGSMPPSNSSKRQLPRYHWDDGDDGIMVQTTLTVKSEAGEEEKGGFYFTTSRGGSRGDGGGYSDGRNWPLSDHV